MQAAVATRRSDVGHDCNMQTISPPKTRLVELTDNVLRTSLVPQVAPVSVIRVWPSPGLNRNGFGIIYGDVVEVGN